MSVVLPGCIRTEKWSKRVESVFLGPMEPLEMGTPRTRIVEVLIAIW